MGGWHQRIFGPSRRARRRAAAEYFHNYLLAGVEGEYVPNAEVVKGYAQAREQHGWPALDAGTLLHELRVLGCESTQTIKVPWSNGSPPKPALPAPEPVASPVVEAEASNPSIRSVRQRPASGSASRDEALAELLDRLDRDETIPSQQALAEAWGRSEGTVSDWLSAWRKAGFIPRPIREGKCNVLQLRKAA
jgi:hypothetical protein